MYIMYINNLNNLGGGFNPSETYARQFGSFPQGSEWKKQYLKPPPSLTLKKSP